MTEPMIGEMTPREIQKRRQANAIASFRKERQANPDDDFKQIWWRLRRRGEITYTYEGFRILLIKSGEAYRRQDNQ